MKQFLLGLFMFCCFFGKGQEIESILNEGNMLYQNGDYIGAISVYEKALSLIEESPELYYNLGNAYYRTSNIPKAILYYEKALKLNPSDLDVKANIALANLQTVDKIEPIPTHFLNQWWSLLVNSKSADDWAILMLSILLLSVFSFVAFLFMDSTIIKKVSFYSSITLIVLGLFVWIIAAQRKSTTENAQAAIVFDANVTVKSEPNNNAAKLFVIHEGTKVNILKREGNYLNISLTNGNEGWLSVSSVNEI